MKKIFLALIILLTLIALAGIYKFNYLSSLPDYDVDGNKVAHIEENEEYFVIETDVDGPDECTEIEEYDAEAGICFVECATELQCEQIEVELDDLLSEMDDEYDNFSQDFTEFEGDSQDLLGKADAVYELSDNEVFTLIGGVEKPTYKKVQRWLAQISPDQFTDDYINRLIIYTDKGGDTAAFVEITPGQVDLWDVYVNMDTMQDGERDMVFTLIHEYAHIMTLNSDQVDPEPYEDECTTFYVGEGCTDTDSYINQFYQKYWKGKFDPLAEDPDVENYMQSPASFVTEYAATNPGEDIAESFASFVFQKQSAPQSIAGQKVNFFYTYPELVEMRDDVRELLKGVVRGRLR